MKAPREKILVFEDTDDQFESLSNALLSIGYGVVRAKDPEEFRQHAPYLDFVAIVMDLFLGTYQVGIDLTKEVKAVNKHVPVVVASHLEPDRSDVAAAFRAGASDYVDKAELIRNMQSTIDRARSITALTDEEIAEQELPLPIAFLFRDFRSSRMSPRRRLERMVELFEVTLKIVAFTLMAAFRTQLPSVLPSDLRAGIARPSLGHFFRIITTLPEVTGFLQPISRATQGRRFRDLCQGFIELRNNYIGHGVLQAGAVYEQLLAQHSSQMIELLYILKDFRRCRIVWAEHADMIENGIEYTVKIFRGSNPEPTLETLLTSFELILKKHVVHLVNEKATESVDLFPWCQYLACEQRCLNEKLFLYRMWREGEIWALDHIYGHELHTRQGWEEVKKLINSGEDM